MSTIINATTTNGVVIQPDNSGSLVLQTNSGTTALTIDTSQNATFAGTVSMGSSFLRNRIINGDMRIDQRNAGASVTANDGVHAVDRFKFSMTQSSKGTGQQSTTAPTGFVNSLLFTSSSAYSVVASDQFAIVQNIEGLNVSDLGWGTANAKTVTLSFWVRSSLTGAFGGALQNSAANRSYPFTYTISAANTWEQKTITIAGDTSGTWLTTNGIGIRVFIGLGMGSTFSGTAGAWAASNFQSATGATSVVGTNGATWYVTGTQLEIGTSATPFERRLYNQELANCQRYYWRNTPGAGAVAVSSGLMYGAVLALSYTQFPVAMRASPTGTLSAATDFTAVGGASTITPSSIIFTSGPLSSRVETTFTGATSGQGMILQSNNSSAWMAFASEL